MGRAPAGVGVADGNPGAGVRLYATDGVAVGVALRDEGSGVCDPHPHRPSKINAAKIGIEMRLNVRMCWDYSTRQREPRWMPWRLIRATFWVDLG